MGEVFEGRLSSEAASKPVAIKLLFLHLCDDPHAVKCFVDEASIGSKLHHPNIVPVHDFGQVDGQYYLAMDLIDGWDTRELLVRCNDKSLRFPVEAAAFIMREVAAALHYLHQHELAIIHRDVSPHNIFIGRDGHVLLSDFGVARASQRQAHTATGHIKGKIAYMAPEQVRGEPVTARADVFAAALVLYELITGERFFGEGPEPQLIAAMCNPVYRSIVTDFPQAAALDPVLERALQSHPARRTRDAETLATQLDDFLKKSSSTFSAPDLAALVQRMVEKDDEETIEFRSRQAQPLPGSGSAAAAAADQQTTWIAAKAGGTEASEERTTVLPNDNRKTSDEPSPLDAVPTTKRPLLPLPADDQPTFEGPTTNADRAPADTARQAASRWVWLRDAIMRWRYWPQLIGGLSLVVASSAVVIAVSSGGEPDAVPPPPNAGLRTASADSGAVVVAAQHDAAAPAAVDSALDGAEKLTIVTIRKAPPPSSDTGLRPTRKRTRRKVRSSKPSHHPAPSTTGDPVIERGSTSPRIASIRPEVYQRKLDALLRRARKRGIGPGDDRRFDRRLREARAAIAEGNGQEDALQVLAEQISSVRIDRAFVRRKLTRLRQAISRAKRAADSARVARLEAASKDALHSIEQGNLAEASGVVSRALSGAK